MIISQRSKFVFIHNPKVAGTSIRTAIGDRHDWSTHFWHQGWSEEAQRVVDLAHIPYRDLPDDVKSIISQSFTFVFVRDPMSRFWASLAEFRRQHADWEELARMPAEGLLNHVLTPAAIRHDWRFTHFCPQHAFFYDGRKCVADFVGHHETFARDWARIQVMIGTDFKPLDNARHRGTTDDEPLTKQGFAKFLNLYAMDYALFGYDIPAEPNLDDGYPESTHWSRVESIHTPYLQVNAELEALMTEGERAAYKQKLKSTL